MSPWNLTVCTVTVGQVVSAVFGAMKGLVVLNLGVVSNFQVRPLRPCPRLTVTF